jgi:hypothetical protein
VSEQAGSWVRSRGIGRILAQETNVSDLIQFLSDRDASPWERFVGFVPTSVVREARRANQADLLLMSDSQVAVIEVKLGHTMSAEQQAGYEALDACPALYLAALSSDRARVEADSKRWDFISLGELIGGWEGVDDELGRLLAREAAALVRSWEQTISAVFAPKSTSEAVALGVLNQKFLARVVTRRIEQELLAHRPLTYAGVTSGGGLPLVQGWVPVRGEGEDRCFIAEVRWRDAKLEGELRFGVDYGLRAGRVEDEEVRRAAYKMARSMSADIRFSALSDHLSESRVDLAALVQRGRQSRPRPRGDWEKVVRHGFAGAPLADGKKNSRQRTAPDFYGDGALRYQAIADVDFGRASARDLVDLIDCTLAYLTSRQP